MRVRVQIVPKTAFGSSLLGEILFGQLCWAIRFRYSEDRLNKLLDGYTTGQPFAVVSDAFPHGYIPLPMFPSFFWDELDDGQVLKKTLKSKRWLSVEDKKKRPIKQWRNYAKSDRELLMLMGNHEKLAEQKMMFETEHMHNTISRALGSTSSSEFAPFSSIQTWFAPNLTLDIYVILDDRFSEEELKVCLEDIGQTGYGRDASVGLGKFEVCDVVPIQKEQDSLSRMTLASTFPKDFSLTEQSFYRVKTHFGRHGSYLAGRNPYKKPLLLAEQGAVFTFKEIQTQDFVGNGIGDVSYENKETVHQGYAPTLSLPSFEI